jgi:hypothetical protein
MRRRCGSNRVDYKLDRKRPISGFAAVAPRVYRLKLRKVAGAMPGKPAKAMSDAERGMMDVRDAAFFIADHPGVELRNRIVVPPMHQYFAINEFRHPALNMTERP